MSSPSSAALMIGTDRRPSTAALATYGTTPCALDRESTAVTSTSMTVVT